MLRKSTDKDISNEELETIINPFYDNYHDYVEEYVILKLLIFISLVIFIGMLCRRHIPTEL